MTFHIVTENIKLKYFVWKYSRQTKNKKKQYLTVGPYTLLSLLIFSPNLCLQSVTKIFAKATAEDLKLQTTP